MEIWMTLLESLFSSVVTAPGFAQCTHDFSSWIWYPGRHVAHAGYWCDTMRSTEAQVVKAWGLNVVLLAVIWSPPWGGHPIALPINLWIHRKGGPTPVELVTTMI